MATIIVTDSSQTVLVKNGDRVVLDLDPSDTGTVTIQAANPGVRNFQIDYGDDTLSESVEIDLSTFEKDDLQIQVNDYDSTDRIKFLGATGQIDPSRLDQYLFEWTDEDGNVLSGRLRVKDQGEKDLSVNPPPIIICFATGTIIDTDLGPTPVEALTAGTLVKTVDNGLQPIRWIGRRHLSGAMFDAHPNLRPVLIRAGALGGGRPWTDLTVSPQHRIRIADWRAELYFGEPEVLVPAKALIDGRTIVESPLAEVTYWHLLFDRHELIWSNGLPSESLHPGDMARLALEDIEKGRLPLDLEHRDTALARPALRVREGLAVAGAA